MQNKDDEESLAETEFVDEIYQIVDAVVPRTDDPTLPALTARVWLLGIGFGTAFNAANTIFSFRTNTFSISPFLAVLMAYPCGLFLAKVIPYGFFNPGPFNYKEHALIYVLASTMSTPPYALANIIGQKYQLYQTDLSLFACIVFAVVTQTFGYGFAGLTRRYLVRPPAMLWPSNFSTIALLRSLHASEDENGQFALSRFAFFWFAGFGMFLFQFLPSYVAPMLGSLSVICWFVNNKPNNRVALMLGSSAPGAGVGLLSFTLDWSFISTYGPITTPLWAMLNQFLGLYLFTWIIVPILWVTNAFGADQAVGSSSVYGFALNSAATYNKNGTRIPTARFVMREPTTRDLILNETFYEANKPLHITTYFAIEYFNSFLVFVAAFVHVGLWYGADIWKRFTTAVRDMDRDDPHARMMDAYEDVPDLWYVELLLFTSIGAILVCQFAFQLEWWGVLVGIALALVTIVPIGTIQAISGQQIGLNVMSEFLIGLILPGRIAAVMAFKTFSYMAMYQGLSLVSDLKLGHYVKIPPKAMFTAQLVSSILGAVVSTLVACGLYESFGQVSVPVSDQYPAGFKWLLQDQDQIANSGWTSTVYNVFLSAGAIWGAVGPARFFGPGSPYFKTLLGFAAGLHLASS
ncbi:OPT oligopeptide transporter protein-domain-containing protein [Chytriomyces sp. MP71]|nr:OPT oligopeptide transporter protein-domain-containing protein [Chytriomyces sp. MP71]